MGFLTSAKLSEYTTKLMTKLRSIFATQAMIGAPKAAATVADMSDTDTIYVYTGSETGYTSGNWYYYDGSGWQSGGVYNAVAVVTDPTFTQSGQAADAAAVGVFKQTFQAFGLALIDTLKKLRWDTTDGVETLEDLEDILLQQKQVVSLSAVFEQGQTVIYNTQSLESLRQYLTVTATYADTTTGAVTGYMLSGYLTPGTSTITVTYRGITTTFTVTVTLTPSLDDIAYGTTTYREMFITNNQCFISDFEMPLTINSTWQNYKTGVYYKLNAGAPSISAAAYNSPGHSLKASGSVSNQLTVEYRSGNQYPLIEGNYFMGACVNCSRRSAGWLGLTFCTPINASSLAQTYVQQVTDGWTAIGSVVAITAEMTQNTYNFFIGSGSTANLDGYVDDIVFIPIPDGMTQAQALELYENFLLRVRLTT